MIQRVLEGDHAAKRVTHEDWRGQAELTDEASQVMRVVRYRVSFHGFLRLRMTA